jgi:hypothetical protein
MLPVSTAQGVGVRVLTTSGGVLDAIGDGWRVGESDGGAVNVGEEGITAAVTVGEVGEISVRAESREQAANPRLAINTKKVNP